MATVSNLEINSGRTDTFTTSSLLIPERSVSPTHTELHLPRNCTSLSAHEMS